ncbi:hypothetical protein [Streptomyces narbonensis]
MSLVSSAKKASDSLRALKSQASGAGTSVKKVGDAGRAANGQLKNLKTAAQGSTGQLKNLKTASDQAERSMKKAGDTAQSAGGKLGKYESGAGKAAKGQDKLNKSMKGNIAFVNWIIDGLNKLSFEIPLTDKKFGVDLDKIPMLADGGIVFPGGDADEYRIDPLSQLENRRVPALTEPLPKPHYVRDFHEKPGAGPRAVAEDLLFLATAHAAA